MASSAGTPPTYGPVPFRKNGQQSILLELYASNPLPTYSQAFRMDIKRGVDADPARVPNDEPLAVPPTVVTSSPPPVASSTGPTTTAGQGIPAFMATGGHGPLSSFAAQSFEQSRASTPVRSRSGSASAEASVSTPGSVAPSNAPLAQLSDAGRNLGLSPIQYDFSEDEFECYVGYALKLEILCPQNLEQHVRGDPRWKGKYVLVKDSNGTVALKFFLLLDTGGKIDSWIFCNLPYADLRKFEISPNHPFTSFHEKQYLKRSRMDVPPESHRKDPDNTAVLHYGIGKALTQLEVAQTVVQFRFKQRDHVWVTLPEFPVGAVVGLSPGDLERGEGGLLALGRTQHGTSAFMTPTRNSGARWKSQTLVKLLVDKNNITEHFFTIFINHPQLVEREENCIIFGPLYNPQSPWIPDDESFWTTIPVAKNSCDWKVFLRRMTFIPKGAAKSTFDISSWMVIDSGSSQTYLPASPILQIDGMLNRRGGNLPNFGDEDEVEFTFATDGAEITIKGQARRFFTSPYPTGSNTRRCCVEVSKTKFLLGLNFFTTFIVAFEDCMDPYARVLLCPHKYV